jgi:protein-tyrosine phosphatase
MIDIHCHFLPGIDDGAETTEEAVDLAKAAVADGITHSIVTPHIHPGRWENSMAIIQNATSLLQAELNKREIPLTLSAGAEVRLTDLLIKQIQEEQLPFLGSLNGCKLLLMEFPHAQLIPGALGLMRWLLQRGIRPVIAHPERNKAIMRNPAVLDEYLEVGCLLQVTAGALTGHFGGTAEQVALQFLDQDKISFVASDAHNLQYRPPVLSQAYKLITQRRGEDVALALCKNNQRALLAGGGGGQ